MNLKEWMFKKKISVTLLSALLHIHRTYLHQLINGKKIPSDKLMEKIREVSVGEVCNKAEIVDRRKVD